MLPYVEGKAGMVNVDMVRPRFSHFNVRTRDFLSFTIAVRYCRLESLQLSRQPRVNSFKGTSSVGNRG